MLNTTSAHLRTDSADLGAIMDFLLKPVVSTEMSPHVHFGPVTQRDVCALTQPRYFSVMEFHTMLS